MKRSFRLLAVLLLGIGPMAGAQTTTSFNFSNSAHVISGWTNVAGDPSTAVRSATAPSGIAISSVATANWSPYGGGSASDGGGENSNGIFPATVLYNHWYSYGGNAQYQAALPQLIITGLKSDSVYSMQLAGSSTNSLNANPTVYTVVGLLNYGVYGVNNQDNVNGSVSFNTIQPDSTGSIRVYVNTVSSSTMADICGLVITSYPFTLGGLSAGMGVAPVGQSLALGDSVVGVGPHGFTQNRYQYLNGFQYSFGGSVKEPVGHPVARWYDNGDLAFSTTMDLGVNTNAQTGLRYYGKRGVLQIGATNRIDTTVAWSSTLEGSWGGGGIVVNSGDSTTYDKTHWPMFDSYLQGGGFYFDTTAILTMVVLNGVQDSLFGATQADDVITGTGIRASGVLFNSTVAGSAIKFNAGAYTSNISGYAHSSLAFLNCGLISGAYNQFGGPFQMATGVNLISRSPSGVVVGSGNVDFPSVPSDGSNWNTAPILGSYPVLILGNANNLSLRSNAWTVLYNGRTQMNTTGFNAGLTQAAVTPQAALDVVSTNTGVLFPRLTGAQQGAIAQTDLRSGLLLYNTDSSTFQYYNGSGWKAVGAGSTSRWQLTANLNYDTLDYVGIGTSNTQNYKLAVNGSAVFTKVVAKPQAIWPDYVFGPGYRLGSLEALGRYIDAHQHLPEVASADEVADHGIDVEAGQRVMLKKVEELTLYVIALNKRAEVLRRDNARLKKQYLKDHTHKNK